MKGEIRMIERKAMLTTFDNPYDPFEDFQNWHRFDTQKGYNTSAYLSRVAFTSNALSDQENNEIIEDAIDEIIKYDFLNIYKKVIKNIEIDEEDLE